MAARGDLVSPSRCKQKSETKVIVTAAVCVLLEKIYFESVDVELPSQALLLYFPHSASLTLP